MCFVTDISEISCVLFCFSLFQAEKVHELNEEIGKLLAKAEQLGAEGNVDEAQKVLQEVEKVRTKKKDAEVSKGCFGGASSLMWWFPHMNYSLSSCFNDTFCLFTGGVQKLYAGFQLPAAEASGVWGVLCLPRSPWQWPSLGRPFRREASPGLHPDQRETGPIKGMSPPVLPCTPYDPITTTSKN